MVTLNKKTTSISIAQKVINVALVPSREGTFVLPEIRIPWFNTLTKEIEFAVIAAQSINVQPAAFNSSVPDVMLPTVDPQPSPVAVVPSPVLPWYQQALPWQISTFIVLIIWALSSWMAPRAPRKNKPKMQQDMPSTSFSSLQKTIDKNAFKHVEQECVEWLSQHFDHQPTLQGYTQALNNDDFSQAVNAMYAFMYNKQGDELQIRSQLKMAIIQLEKVYLHTGNLDAKTTLRPLYPNT